MVPPPMVLLSAVMLLLWTAASAQHNVVFVTSTTHTGNLGGLAGADSICQSRANAAGLSGTFRAWLSNSTTSAVSRLGSARGFVRRDGAPVADTLAGLTTSAALLNAIDRDETSAQLTSGTVWTATSSNGTYFANGSCNDWTSSSPALSVLTGSAKAGPGLWTNSGLNSCSAAMRLYCFQTDFNTPLIVPPPTGRLVFLSSTAFSLGGGIAAADAKCMTEAQSAGLTGTYKALLATTTGTAVSRWDNSNINYQRRDGVTVGTIAELGGTTGLHSGIWQLADGSYPSTSNIAVWTGSTAPNVLATIADSCNNWTNNVSGSSISGRVGYVNSQWWVLDTTSCSATHARLYCAQTDTPATKRQRGQTISE